MDIVIQGAGAEAFAEKLNLRNIWIKPDAVRVNEADSTLTQELVEQATKQGFDVNCVPNGLSIKNFGLLALDMDSTLIELECIDDIAWQCGVGEEVARMTEIAMQGHMPFAEYLRERVKLFKGHPAHYVEVTASHAKELGMTGYLCNRLIEKDGVLTGETTGPGGGEILDADGKRRALDMLCMLYGLHHSQAIAGGDGANDLEMIKTAGLGFAYHGKPIVAASAPYRVNHGGLDVVINLFIEAWDKAKKL